MAPHPDLTSLATEALTAHTAVLVSADGTRPVVITARPDPVGPPEPLLGVRCTTAIDAVAYPAWIEVRRDGCIHDDVIGLAVDRRGRVEIASSPSTSALTPAGPADVGADIGLRALGLATPPPDEPVRAFVDRLWVDRILELALLADLGDPPGWPVISRAHPLSDGRICSPEHLRAARAAFDVDWSRWRRSAADAGLEGGFMSSSLAHWFDDGSFARRLLATVPDAAQVLDDLDDLLRPRHAEWVRAALRDTLGVR